MLEDLNFDITEFNAVEMLLPPVTPAGWTNSTLQRPLNLDITAQEMTGFACLPDYRKSANDGYYKLTDFAVEKTWEAIVDQV
jgi:hypothetical protein